LAWTIAATPTLPTPTPPTPTPPTRSKLGHLDSFVNVVLLYLHSNGRIIMYSFIFLFR